MLLVWSFVETLQNRVLSCDLQDIGATERLSSPFLTPSYEERFRLVTSFPPEEYLLHFPEKSGFDLAGTREF